MCGLVGVAGNLFDNDVARFKNLISANRIRGPFATGIGAAPYGIPRYVKIAGYPEELLELENVKKLLNTKSNVLIGHNRWPTVGGNKSDNAHPYLKGDILGAHNGTVTDWYIKNLPVETEGGTDSERLFDCISQVGIEETVKYLKGAWAFTWFDAKNETLNFLRNKERPLYMVSHKNGNRIAWASEAKMLDWIMSRSEQQHPDWEYDKDGIVEVPESTLITVDLKKVGVAPLKITARKIEQELPRPQPQKNQSSKEYWRTSTDGSTEYKSVVDMMAEKQRRLSLVPPPKKLADISYDDLYAEYAALNQSQVQLRLRKRRLFDELASINWSMQWNWHETFRKCMMGKVTSVWTTLQEITVQFRKAFELKQEMDRRDQKKQSEAARLLQAKAVNSIHEVQGPPNKEAGEFRLSDYFQSFERRGVNNDIEFQKMRHAFHGCAYCGCDNFDAFQPTERSILLPGTAGPVGMVCVGCTESVDIQKEIVQAYGDAK